MNVARGKRRPRTRCTAAVTVGFAVLVLAAAACGSGSTKSGSSSGAKGSPYTIGVLVSKTGSASQLGVGEAQGAQLEAQQINQSGGINGHPVKLTVLDDQSSATQAVQQGQSLISGHVAAIIGPSLVATCNAVAPLVSQGPIEYCLSPGISPKPNSYVWSASTATQVNALRAMQYWKQQGITKIGLIHTTDATGLDGEKQTKAAVASVGGTVTADAGYAPDAVDVTSQLQQIKASHPQGIVVWATGTPVGVAIKGLQQLGLNLPVFTTNGNLADVFAQRIQPYAPKTLLLPATTDFWFEQLPPSSPVRQLNATYHSAFQAAYHYVPDFGPGAGYDSLRIVADVLRHVGTNPAKMKAYLQGLHGFPSVLGTYSFSPTDHRGLGIDSVAVVKVTGGGFTYVGK